MDSIDHTTKGFNDGYLLQKHQPELANLLDQSLHASTDYIEAMQAGRAQYLSEMRERLREHTHSRPDHVPPNDQDHGLGIER